jgi:hypothetical protein
MSTLSRVLVSTDIGGTDPDDFQSMVHLLLYADALDIEGLLSSPYGDGRVDDILAVIDAYETDYGALSTHARYPAPDALRALVKQGALEVAPDAGFADPTEGSEWIVACARRDDPRPLNVLVWGGIDDVAQALHDAPDIASKIVVHYIGGPNKTWGVDAYDYVENHHRDVTLIESNNTYRGFFVGADDDDLSPTRFSAEHAAGRGALGEFFAKQLPTVKMGDTPTVTWVLHGPQRPDQPSWGGRYVPVWDARKSRIAHPATPADVVEAFGVVEILAPKPPDWGEGHHAELLFDARTQGPFPQGIDEGEHLRFRLSPRDIRPMDYEIRSSHPALDGQRGSFTAARPVERWTAPSSAYRDWWCDDLSPELAIDGWPGAATIAAWRPDFMRDFADRLTRTSPRSSQ